MRKAVIVFVLALFLKHGMAQTSHYFPFPDSNAVWTYVFDTHCFMGGTFSQTQSIIMSGDTTINAQVYHKLNTPIIHNTYVGICAGGSGSGYSVGYYQGAIRQDSIARKVFIVPSGSTAEVLLYDFNLNIGDSVTGYLQANTFISQLLDVVLDVDSFLVNGFYHRALLINFPYSIYLIEGVGSTYGLVHPSPGNISDFEYCSFFCMKQNGLTNYTRGVGACNVILSSDNYLENPTAAIYSNPVHSSCQIEVNPSDPIVIAEIYSSYGTRVFKKNFINESVLNWNREFLTDGVYFLKLSLKSGKLINVKLVLN